jgi:hypothetical protein
MEEMNNTDTPQPQTANTTGMDPFGASTENNEGSDNNNLSVEDAFFGKADTNNQSAPEEGQPAGNQETPLAEQPYEAKNDNKRFEYWQSQAAKKENELGEYKMRVEQAIKAQQSQQVPNQEAARPAQEFPPPPQKPKKPQGFSREEAWNDPNSESARYLDGVDSWQDDMGEYRDLRSQYDLAIIRERFEAEDNAKKARQEQMTQYNETKKQVKDVYNHVTGHYGFSDAEAKDFIKSMSNSESVSMDNLVQLYRMNTGAGQVNTQSKGPSEAFQQSRNAQQVPSPMGVMPAQATESKRSDADSIMDDLINSHKSKNPWT